MAFVSASLCPPSSHLLLWSFSRFFLFFVCFLSSRRRWRGERQVRYLLAFISSVFLAPCCAFERTPLFWMELFEDFFFFFFQVREWTVERVQALQKASLTETYAFKKKKKESSLATGSQCLAVLWLASWMVLWRLILSSALIIRSHKAAWTFLFF